MSDGWWSKLTDAEREAICKRKSERYWAARQEHGYFTSKGKPETLCWSCQRAVKECPWSANFEPVDGWEADETKVMGAYGVIPSYFVRRCPLYEPDPEPKEPRKRRRKKNVEEDGTMFL